MMTLLSVETSSDPDTVTMSPGLRSLASWATTVTVSPELDQVPVFMMSARCQVYCDQEFR